MRLASIALFLVVGCNKASGGLAIEPAPSAAATASSSAAPTSTSTSTSTASVAPLPAVKVENIGMHIGGGPNNPPTKEPIASSVAPHFDAFRECWAQIESPTRGGDFGVDLLIEEEGGKATVSNPRTTLKPDAFKDCVMEVFRAIDFQKPRFGKTMVSYSLRFTP